MRGRHGARASFGWVLVLAGPLSACVQILGDDFTIRGGGGGGGASAGGGGAGAGPVVGGGGAGPVGTLSCEVADARQIVSLEGQVGDQFSSRIHVARGDHNLRAFVGRSAWDGGVGGAGGAGGAGDPGPDGPVVEVWSIDANADYVQRVPGYEPLQARRVDGTTVGAILARQDANGGHGIDYLRIDDADTQGSDLSVVPLVVGLNAVQGMDARFDRVAGTSEDIALLITHRASTTAPFQARFASVAPSEGPTSTVVFDDSSTNGNLSSADYRPTAFVRDDAGDNHAIFREVFDGATRVRHFVIPDAVSGTIAPVIDDDADASRLMFGVNPRADGRFTVGYGEIVGANVTLRVGAIDDQALTTHDSADIPIAGDVAFTEIPGESAFVLTEESVVFLGTSSDPSALRLIIGHSSGTIRTNETVTLPSGLMPEGAAIQRLAALTASPTFDGAFGGELLVVWYADVPPDNHSRLFFAAVNCQ